MPKAKRSSEPVTTEPANAEPANAEPAANEPAANEPANGEPANGEPVKAAAASGEPAPTTPRKSTSRRASKVNQQATAPDAAVGPATEMASDESGGGDTGPADTTDDAAAEFLVEQRALLLRERASYTKQADELKAEADSLALEHEPGDVQFDEEGGEGGTSNVDRELDLVLSAQALNAVAEIDRALAKIDTGAFGAYGVCEQCGKPIPAARLKALPQAALCVGCKSGGLSRR